MKEINQFPSTCYPVVGICGYSNSGKTTLIESILPELKTMNIQTSVIKHCRHHLEVDRAGKDSDRIFKSGGNIYMHTETESFYRSHDSCTLEILISDLASRCDLVLVEGHKTTPLPKQIWLCRDDSDMPPDDTANETLVLKPEDPRPEEAMNYIRKVLDEMHREIPVYAGILVGGKSSRMNGYPKHLNIKDNKTWLEATVDTVKELVDRIVFIGKADIPENMNNYTQLPDLPSRTGPISGMLAAMRWQPLASWIFIACDMPNISKEAILWLLDQRAPGRWAVIPKLTDLDKPEPLFALYDLRSRHIMETLSRPSAIAEHPKTVSPAPPVHIEDAWLNVNTIHDMEKLA